jgi:putative PIN family toxin of toxin-antitoxin system
MKNASKKRVIIDTNCWISFLIGKRLAILVDLIVNESIDLIVCDDLLEEIIDVTRRPKFTKHFSESDVAKLIKFILSKSERYELEYKVHLCRDVADDYLLDLATISNADYLLTGDADLLVLRAIGKCKIIDIKTFENLSI